MVEIAIAFLDIGAHAAARHPRRADLVARREPRRASSLAHVRRFVAAGGAVVFISHILSEVLEISDRVVVMKDGRSSPSGRPQGFDARGLVAAMGSVARERGRGARGPAADRRAGRRQRGGLRA